MERRAIKIRDGLYLNIEAEQGDKLISSARFDNSPLYDGDFSALSGLASQIIDYAKGDYQSPFDFTPFWRIERSGATDFQIAVWERLLKIPFGQTETYGTIAKDLGTAPRAVGRAVASNRLLLIVPCHRVIAINGLGGYSCGLEIKRLLLNLEGVKSDASHKKEESSTNLESLP